MNVRADKEVFITKDDKKHRFAFGNLDGVARRENPTGAYI
jgi:hypothetical protein